MSPAPQHDFSHVNGALLVNKHAGVSSFGIIEILEKQFRAAYGIKRSELPKLGHGGTLDPFATGLLVVCVGRAVKLARYFLGSTKTYTARIRFGETTASGDVTDAVTERTERVPSSLEELQNLARELTKQPYLQTPPMHSAKKRDGKPLYELARQGIEVAREPKLCHLHEFAVESYEKPHARIHVRCSAGTYIRTLAQDYGRLLGTLGMLEELNRTGSGEFSLERALTTDEIGRALTESRPWDQLPCWVPFDRMLESHARAEATPQEAQSLFQGKQAVLFGILKRAEIPESETLLPLYSRSRLIAIARKTDGAWALERVFLPDEPEQA